MNGNILVIPFAICMVGMIVMLLTNIVKLDVVKAGKADKPCKKSLFTLSGRSKTVYIDGQKKNVSDYKKMIVCGNSMKKYDVVNNQIIFVRLFNDEDKGKIVTHPILVLNIVDNPNKDDAQYKLRKFISYYCDEKWEDIFDSNASRISGITKEKFVSMCSEKYAKMSESERENLILSETFDEDNKTVQYSLHPVSSIYGKVVYAQ